MKHSSIILILSLLMRATGAAPNNILRNNVDDIYVRQGQREDEAASFGEFPIIPIPPPPDSDEGLPFDVWMHYRQEHMEAVQELYQTYDKNNINEPSSHLPQLKHSPNGTFPNLVLLLRFSDHANRTLPTQDDISRLYNSEDTVIDDHESIRGNDRSATPTGSVRQVYLANSYSTFHIETTVVDWITLNNTEAYYADGKRGLSKSKFKEAMVEALDVLDARGELDFGNFDLDSNEYLDGFGVLHSGYAAEFGGVDCQSGATTNNRIWSHKGGVDWTSSDGSAKVNRYYVASALRGKCHANIVRMGVLCHELGHYVGLPDLYDPTFNGKGLGAYDFMSSSWGFDGTGLFPPSLSAWSRIDLGWANVVVIDTDGEYQLEASEYNNTVYKITRNFPEDEYLLLENRQPIGYDSKIQQGGIAVYHVDDTAIGQRHCGMPAQEGWPENGAHYQVALLEASGNYSLEEGLNDGSAGDLWHANSALHELGPGWGGYVFPNTDSYRDGNITETGIRLYDFSASGNIMSFRVAGVSQPTSAPSPDTLESTLENVVSIS